MDLKEFLKAEIVKEQKSLIDAIAFKPCNDYPAYREAVGEIRGLQRVIRYLEDLPNDD